MNVLELQDYYERATGAARVRAGELLARARLIHADGMCDVWHYMNQSGLADVTETYDCNRNKDLNLLPPLPNQKIRTDVA